MARKQRNPFELMMWTFFLLLGLFFAIAFAYILFWGELTTP